MKKFNMLTVLFLTLMFSVPSAFAAEFQPLYGQASIVMPAEALTEFTFVNIEGATEDDSFPNAEWCQSRGANPSGPGCQPDGWVTREDSPYHNVKVRDLGQEDLYADFHSNQVVEYPAYAGSKPWNKLTPYGKMLAHMTNQYTITQTGWDVLIRAKVHTTVEAFNNWQQSVDRNGFSDEIAVLFTEDAFEVNTHFFKYQAGDNAAVGLQGSDDIEDKVVWIDMYIPLDDKAVFDKLVEDFEQWNTVPVQKLQTVEQTEEGTVYKK